MQSTLTMLGVAMGTFLIGALNYDERFLFCALVVTVAAGVNFALQALYLAGNHFFNRSAPSPFVRKALEAIEGAYDKGPSYDSQCFDEGVRAAKRAVQRAFSSTEERKDGIDG